MRDVIGIIVGILGFLLITVYTVKRHSTVHLASGKAVASPVKEPPVAPAPRQSPTPPVPAVTRPTEASIAPAQPLESAPLSRPSGSPDKVIYFKPGYTGLSPHDRTALNGLLPTLRKAPDARIEIHGHTDDLGHPQFNRDLSRLRADIVHYYLQAQGIAESRFTVGGHGASAPTSDNRSTTGRQRNRRTEIFIQQESLRRS